MVRLVSILRPTSKPQGEMNMKRTLAFTAVAAAMALMGQMAVPVLADEGRGLEAVPVKGMTVSETFEVGFDYRNGGHCGAGAPRFNVTTRDGVFSFVGGCSNGTASPAPQDPLEWTRVLINVTSPSQAFPPLAVGSQIESISIIYDEGTDTATSDSLGVGLAVLDNIHVNGELITGRGYDGKDDD